MSASRFEEAYKGTPPWDIGRAQPAFERVADAGLVTGPVLDAGCGTGENALFFAARGFEAVGVDAVEAAIAAARAKAAARGLTAEFLVHDALALGELGRRFGDGRRLRALPHLRRRRAAAVRGFARRRHRPRRARVRPLLQRARARWTAVRGA